MRQSMTQSQWSPYSSNSTCWFLQVLARNTEQRWVSPCFLYLWQLADCDWLIVTIAIRRKLFCEWKGNSWRERCSYCESVKECWPCTFCPQELHGLIKLSVNSTADNARAWSEAHFVRTLKLTTLWIFSQNKSRRRNREFRALIVIKCRWRTKIQSLWQNL